MKGYHDSKTPANSRDLWMTPGYVFNYYNRRFNFTHDVAASDENHLAPAWITQEQNALTANWGSRNWLNPPYSETALWIEKALTESWKGKIVVMLLPASTSTAWFEKAFECCTEMHIITGRIGFISNETGEPVNNNNAGSVVFVFDGRSPIHRQTAMIRRDDMKVA